MAIEKLAKIACQVKNHLGSLLFGIDKTVENLLVMVKVCLGEASVNSHHSHLLRQFLVAFCSIAIMI